MFEIRIYHTEYTYTAMATTTTNDHALQVANALKAYGALGDVWVYKDGEPWYRAV